MTTLWLFLSACAGTIYDEDAGITDFSSGDTGVTDLGSHDGESSLDQFQNENSSLENTEVSGQDDCPLGSPCKPIVIDTFSYSGQGDTAASNVALYDSYSCNPGQQLLGAEIYYELVVNESRVYEISLVENSGADVAFLLLSASDPNSCLVQSSDSYKGAIFVGRYQLIVDSILEGPYTLNLSSQKPTALGTMWNTYYIMSAESDYTGAQDTPIYTSTCQQIALVRLGFYNDVCIQGSGKLEDGRVINYASTCGNTCPQVVPCDYHSVQVCYSVLDSSTKPWGSAANGQPLIPEFTVAVDPNLVP